MLASLDYDSPTTISVNAKSNMIVKIRSSGGENHWSLLEWLRKCGGNYAGFADEFIIAYGLGYRREYRRGIKLG